jgi:hypothetical protein
MVKLFLVGFLYINILANFIVCSDVDTERNENAGVVTVHKASTRYSPDSALRFSDLFQDKRFWTSKNTSFSSKAFCISYPQLFFNTVSSESLNAHLKSMHSAEPVLNDITKLSNQILKIYGLKNKHGFPVSFNLNYPFDKTILREALCSFLRIINTRDPNRTKGYEWKAQTFFRVFSQLCSSLNIEEKDTELNLGMRQMVAISLGLSPLNYKKWFQEQYPSLAKHIKTCARNKSRKPLAATFTLSLMHALIPKMYAPLAAQIAIDISLTNRQEEVPSGVAKILSPTPKRVTTGRKLASLASLKETDSKKRNFGPYFETGSFGYTAN